MRILVFSCPETEPLVELAIPSMKKIAEEHDVIVSKGEVRFINFSNKNRLVELVSNVRDVDTVIFCTQTEGLHDQLFDLFLFINAAIGAKARSVSVVFPYMPYSRSDRRDRSRVSVGGEMLPLIINTLGVKSVLLIEPHAVHLKHFFKPTADEIPLAPFLAHQLKNIVAPNRDEWVLVFPDTGAAKRFEELPIFLGIDSATIQKSRKDHSESLTTKRIIGQVKDKNCILFDDEILTGTTLVIDAKKLLQEGAKSVRACCVHAPLAKNGLSNDQLLSQLFDSPIEEFLVTNTVDPNKKVASFPRFSVIDVMPIIGEATTKMLVGASLSPMHDFEHYT